MCFISQVWNVCVNCVSEGMVCSCQLCYLAVWNASVNCVTWGDDMFMLTMLPEGMICSCQPCILVFCKLLSPSTLTRDGLYIGHTRLQIQLQAFIPRVSSRICGALQNCSGHTLSSQCLGDDALLHWDSSVVINTTRPEITFIRKQTTGML